MQNILITLIVLVVGTLLLSVFRKDPDQATPSNNTPSNTTPKPDVKPDVKPDPTPNIQNTQSAKSEPETEVGSEDSAQKVKTEEPETPVSPPKEEEPQTPAEPEKPAAPVKSEKKAIQKYNKIVIYGSNDSHKTKLFYSLLLNKDPQNFQTVTSISPIISNKFIFNEKPTTLVDVPGHSNFETKIGKFLEKNSLLLFVLRTNSKQHNYLGKSAHKLYEILTKQNLSSMQISVKLAIVKDDGFGGSEQENDFIKEFEKEIERIKFSRRTHVNAEDDGTVEGDYLKNIRENFVLDHIRAKDCSCFFLELGKDSLIDKINLN